jgi:hypothetical protein
MSQNKLCKENIKIFGHNNKQFILQQTTQEKIKDSPKHGFHISRNLLMTKKENYENVFNANVGAEQNANSRITIEHTNRLLKTYKNVEIFPLV